MDPLSALIGGGASIIGSFMNTSSQQAINAANLQFATQQATGSFLPQYYKNQVAGATAAGINPLAVIGSGSGAASAPERIGTQPGAGLMQAGKDLMQADFAHAATMKKLDEDKARVDLANARLAGNNTAQQIVRDAWITDALKTYYALNPRAPPPGAQESTLSGMGAGTIGRMMDVGPQAALGTRTPYFQGWRTATTPSWAANYGIGFGSTD